MHRPFLPLLVFLALCVEFTAAVGKCVDGTDGLTDAVYKAGNASTATCVPEQAFYEYAGDVELTGNDCNALTRIEEYAFRSMLGKVTIDCTLGKLEHIGAFAFNRAGNAASSINFSGTRLLKNIGNAAFSLFKGFVTISGDYPALTDIGDYAFYKVNAASSVNLSGALLLKYIGDHAFNQFKGAITISGAYPALADIGELAFAYASNPGNSISIACSSPAGPLTVGNSAFLDYVGAHNASGEQTPCNIDTATTATTPTPTSTSAPITTTSTSKCVDGSDRLTIATYTAGNAATATCVPADAFNKYAGDVELTGDDCNALARIEHGAFREMSGKITINCALGKLEHVGMNAFTRAGNAASSINLSGALLLKDIDYGAFSDFKGAITISGNYPALTDIGKYAFFSAKNPDNSVSIACSSPAGPLAVGFLAFDRYSGSHDPSGEQTSCNCENVICAAGWYRAGTCGADGKGFTCSACDNLQCTGEHEYRAGTCGGEITPTANAYTCDTHEPCPDNDTYYIPSNTTHRTCPPCPAGQHQPSAAHRERNCIDTTSTTTTTTATTTIDECATNPCVHGGACTDGEKDYTCKCKAGYTGKNCQSNIDDCATEDCSDHGTCSDRINDFSCTCNQGWNGRTCETAGTCEFGSNGALCLNNGSPKGVTGQCECECSAGYSGANCQTDIDDCEPSPCKNSGVCTDGVNTHTCACGLGWEGDDCGVATTTTTRPATSVNTSTTLTSIMTTTTTATLTMQGDQSSTPKSALTSVLVAMILIVLIVIVAAWYLRRNAKNNGAAIPRVITNKAALRAGAGALASVPATYNNRMYTIEVETSSSPTDGDGGSGIAPANGDGDSRTRAGSTVYAIPMEDGGVGSVGGRGASASSSNDGVYYDADPVPVGDASYAEPGMLSDAVDTDSPAYASVYDTAVHNSDNARRPVTTEYSHLSPPSQPNQGQEQQEEEEQERNNHYDLGPVRRGLVDQNNHYDLAPRQRNLVNSGGVGGGGGRGGGGSNTNDTSEL